MKVTDMQYLRLTPEQIGRLANGPEPKKFEIGKGKLSQAHLHRERSLCVVMAGCAICEGEPLGEGQEYDAVLVGPSVKHTWVGRASLTRIYCFSGNNVKQILEG